MPIQDEKLRIRLQRMDQVTGALMVLAPIAAIVAFRGASQATFFLEMTGLWAFSAFWFVKSWEIRKGCADEEPAAGTRDFGAQAAS